MPFIATPQGIEVKLIMEQNSIPVVNVWNVDYGAAVTPTALTNVRNVFDAWVTASYKTLLSPSIKFDQWIVTDVSVANGAQDISTPTATVGTAPAGESAANAAFVASLRTLHTGRNFRGRTYVPGIPQTYVSDAQHASTGYATSVNASFVSLIAALSVAGYKLCVLSRYLAGALRAVGLLTEIISVITDTKIDSQRRRTAN
jgi:hypothetical protein